MHSQGLVCHSPRSATLKASCFSVLPHPWRARLTLCSPLWALDNHPTEEESIPLRKRRSSPWMGIPYQACFPNRMAPGKPRVVLSWERQTVHSTSRALKHGCCPSTPPGRARHSFFPFVQQPLCYGMGPSIHVLPEDYSEGMFPGVTQTSHPSPSGSPPNPLYPLGYGLDFTYLLRGIWRLSWLQSLNICI